MNRSRVRFFIIVRLLLVCLLLGGSSISANNVHAQTVNRQNTGTSQAVTADASSANPRAQDTAASDRKSPSPMLFTAPIFLFFFLPAVLGLYFISPKRLRNALLLGASLLFYAWGEGLYIVVLLSSLVVNYLGGVGIEQAQQPRQRRLVLWTIVVANLGLLVAFKYSHFLAINLNALLHLVHLNLRLPEPVVHLPIGISFFTFMGLSYVIDIYRRQLKAQTAPIHFALYITLFPHLIAGPIVRYSEIAAEIIERQFRREEFAEGIRRFIIGLGKKMIIANTVALTADSIFNLPAGQLAPAVAWLGILCYSLQIYFDFSGYSDMAIGLARMFGFHFPENFNYPYSAESIADFWKRWHITLSTWFRDYLFFPLSIRRTRRRLYVNLLIVFLLCGLWHGASWSFVIWGLFHGSFLVIERMGLTNWLSGRARIIRHLYALLVILIGWVFFRAETLSGALAFLAAMFGRAATTSPQWGLTAYLNNQLLIALVVGVVGATPLIARLQKWGDHVLNDSGNAPVAVLHVGGRLLRLAALAAIFIISVALSAAGTYNPFIYFRF